MLSGAGEAYCERRRVAVLQLDICQFTTMSQTMDPLDVARMLHRVYSAFDADVRCRCLQKMDTVGDAYIVAGWLPDPFHRCGSAGADRGDAGETGSGEIRAGGGGGAEAQAVCEGLLCAARTMLTTLAAYRAATGIDVHCRIGIAAGGVIAGVLGRLQPRQVACCLGNILTHIICRLQ